MSNYDDPLDNLTEFVGEPKGGVITIHIGGPGCGGVVWAVEGVPPGYTVKVLDYDEGYGLPVEKIIHDAGDPDWEDEIRWEDVR